MTQPTPQHSCTCRPAWPELVVHTDDGRALTVHPAESSGGLSCLYHARCAGCTAIYPGSFRIPSRTAA